MTPQKGFIRNTEYLEAKLRTGEISSESELIRIRAEKEQLHIQAWSIAKELPALRDALIPVNRQNRIFDNLALQLSHDTLLHAILRVERHPAALEQLLVSASVYQSTFGAFRKDRRIINRGNSAAGIPRGFLYKSNRYLLSPSVRKSVPSSVLPDSLPPAGTFRLFAFNIFRQFDRLNEGGYRTINFISGVFGSSVASIRKDPPVVINPDTFVPYLQPLDIILMKSEGNFTDKLIPGYFGHTVVWARSGLPDRYSHLPDHEPDSEPLFIESVRSGVKYSTVGELSDATVMVVIRVFGLSGEEREVARERLFSHVGKLYDFNFDLESPARLFCTELPYLIFDQITWVTQHVYGRFTMSPDDIIRTALKDDRLKLMMLITHDQVVHMPAPELIEGLITP